MGSVDFLNLAYILTTLSNFLWGDSSAQSGGANQGLFQGLFTTQSGSNIISQITYVVDQVAIGGLAVAFILLCLGLYIRIKLELYEHEEFHKREAAFHPHDAHGAHGSHDTHAAQGGHTETHEPEVTNTRWEEVHTLAGSASESDWRRAIMEADIMLGDMLSELGYRGNSIGDKLKDANPLQFTTLDLAWKAHKVRNDIAHGGEGFHLSERDTQAAIDQYRRVFEEFKFI